MSDDRMAMYEAQAIAVEQRLEIDRLRRERDELAEGMRLLALQLGRTEESQDGNNDDVLAAINRLTGQMEALQNRVQEVDDRVQQNTTSVWEAINDLRQRDSAIRNLQEQTDKYTSKLQQHTGQTTILILGGNDGKIVYDNLVILKEGKWIDLPLKLPEANNSHGTIYLEGEIYIFGGTWEEEVYKLDKNLKWTRLADIKQKRLYITNSCLEWNGCIWVFGGSSDSAGKEALKSVEKYDPKEGKWTEMRPMKQARHQASADVWNGKFMICGGGCDKIRLKSVECFDPESGVWTVLDDLPSPLSEHAIVSYGNKLIILGGWRGEATNTILELSNCEGKQLWKELPSMKCSRHLFPAAVLNDEIYAIGGWDGTNELVETEIFDGRNWRNGPNLPRKTSYMSAIAIPQHFADSLLNYKP